MTKETTTRIFDLKPRTAKFGLDVIGVARAIPYDAVTKPLISQLVRAATSIGANYMEADGAVTRKDFMYKVSLCKKEAMETSYWLTMLSRAEPSLQQRLLNPIKECRELILIFAAISRRGNCV